MARNYSRFLTEELEQIFENNKFNLQILEALHDEIYNYRALRRRALMLDNRIVDQMNVIKELIQSSRRQLRENIENKDFLLHLQEQISPYRETAEAESVISEISIAIEQIETKARIQVKESFSVENIHYIAPYYRKNKSSYSKEPNPKHDNFSSMILQLKKGAPDGIEFFYPFVKKIETAHHVLCVVPSSRPDSTSSGLKKLVSKLITNASQDGIDCLVRHAKVDPAHWGNRDMNKHFESISVVKPHIIMDQNVILFDDVVTTGNTLMACRKILLDAGARDVQCFALGKTTQ